MKEPLSVIILLCFTGLTVALSGCVQLLNLTPEEYTAATETLMAWFDCEECEEGELDAVTKYGKEVVPILAAVVVDGASPASLELMRRGLERRYEQLVAYSETHPDMKLVSSEEEFVAMYLDNYDAKHRVRAAEALSIIGGKKAEKALEQALKKVKHDDERKRIKIVLEKLRSGSK